MIIDSHAHCQFRSYGNETENMMKRNLEKKVVVNIVGTEKGTSSAAVEMADKYPDAYASIGLHPGHLFSEFHDTGESENKINEKDFDVEFYESLAKHPKVVGIGECGLDFYRLPENVSREIVIKKQTEVFLLQATIAKKYNLPLVIHCREAHPEMISTLSSMNDFSGTMHCYTSNWENAKKYLDLGLYLGFTGVITFPPQKKNPLAQEELWQVIKNMPLERILVETDCPYLAPVPYRGKQGEPWMVEEVIKKIAELRGESVELIRQKTTENALRLFSKMK
ncbi:MAG: TatD family hydrolase [Patescibacteria group bacterium]|jgi:TatD DNase family protein